MVGLLYELRRRKVYRVAAAYAVVAWLLVQVATQVFPFFDVPNWGVRLVVLLALFGFPVAVTLAWIFDMTPDGVVATDDPPGLPPPSRQRWRRGLALGLIVGGASVAVYLLARPHVLSGQSYDARPTRTADASIAVLPFTDLSQAKDQGYFSDGISEELVATLGKIPGLRVAASASSFALRQQHLQSHELARILNVGHLLQGSVRRQGQRVRITVELIDAGSGFNLWSETYERQVGDIFQVQEDISRSIGEALKVRLAIATPKPHGVDPAAYDLYLQGMFFSNKSDETSLRHSLSLLQASLAKDPGNARAWSGIAKDWNWLADAYVRPLDAYPQSRSAALKALTLDPSDADAIVYLAETMRVLNHDLAGAEAGFRKALKINPNSAHAHSFLGLLLGAEGDRASGLAELEQARKLDPLSTDISNMLAMVYTTRGRYDDAINESRRLHSLDAGYVYGGSFLGDAYRDKGMYPQAIEAYQQAERLSGLPEPGMAITYVRLGKVEQARQILVTLEQVAQHRYYAGEAIASIHAELGDKDAAFHWLQTAYDEHSAALMGLGVRAEFANLRDDPRYVALLVKLGLDPRRVATANSQLSRQVLR